MNEVAPTLEVVSFMAGGWRFGVEAARVRAQVSEREAGTALAAEDLLDVAPDLFSLSGFQRILLMKHGPGDVAVLVTEPVQLHHVELERIHPLPELIAASIGVAGAKALALTEQGIIVLVDLRLRPRAGADN